MTCLAALAVLALVQDLPSDASADAVYARPIVTSFEREGRTWFTVRAKNASAKAVLGELGRLSNRRVAGTEVLDRSGALVTVDLETRPLEQVLEYTLGSLGLEYRLERDEIGVLSEASRSADELLELATAAWVRATTRFPEHPLAAQGRLYLGEIAEHRGLLGVARNHYLSLIEDHPNAAVVGEAYMRAGRLSARRGQWGEAARLFRTLASIDHAAEFAAPARLEWARTMVAQGDPQSALYMLTALDSNFPADDEAERTARRLVRARALNELGQHMEALEEIDLDDADFDELGHWEALTIRAEALEGIGMPGEAASAWLLFATEATGPEQAFAFQSAARLALESGDELAVLFVVRQAAEADVTLGLERYEEEARRRLGFDVDAEELTLEDRVARAEAWLDENDFEQARGSVEPLFLAQGALDPALAARVCVAWARCLDDSDGLRAAVDLLDGLRREFEDPEAQRTVDVGVARLFERHGRFDEAVQAYQGRYVLP